MTIIPDIVKILRQEEKLGKLRFNIFTTKQELDFYESTYDNIKDDPYFNSENEIIKFDYSDKIPSENDYKIFSDLIERINY